MTHSDTGFEHMIDNDHETVFVVDNFDGSIFQQLQRAGCRIVSPAVILRCTMYGEVWLHLHDLQKLFFRNCLRTNCIVVAMQVAFV